MCGRYLYFDQKNARIQSMMEQLRMSMEPEAFSQLSLGEVFPSQCTPVCRLTEAGAELVPAAMSWGMPRPTGKGLIINARSETAAKSRMFADSLRQRRCLICSCGYYEWEKTSRRRYYFTPDNQEILYMAGFYQSFPEAPDRFVIMTRPALPEIEFIHDRMPVIFEEREALNYLQGRSHLTLVPHLLFTPA